MHHWNANLWAGAPKLALATVKRDLAIIRAEGYSVSYDRVTPNAGIVAAALPASPEGMPLVVGIGGLSQTIRTNAVSFGKLIRGAIKRHLQSMPAVDERGK